MNMLASIKGYIQSKVTTRSEKAVTEAYDIWSGSYDEQPGNLMLDLDADIFTELIRDFPLENKVIADIGCGTGRHWQQLYDRSPQLVMGYDVSEGMLQRLKAKFPAAKTNRVTDNLLADLADSSLDGIISTLTIAHIENIDEAIASWCRVLKKGGELLITDFHPALLAQGGKRSFRHDNKNYSVKNFVHPLEIVKKIFVKYGFSFLKQQERYIDERVRSYYEVGNALELYNRFHGMPVIYGLHLKK